MQICYWCPFLTHIATIDAVKNSAISLKKYSNQTQNTKIKILNTFGEWDFYKKNNDNVIIQDLQKFNFHKQMPKEGFFSSRFTFLIIFFLTFTLFF